MFVLMVLIKNNYFVHFYFFIVLISSYSIIKNNNPDFNLDPNFSIHRITQSIILNYILFSLISYLSRTLYL